MQELPPTVTQYKVPLVTQPHPDLKSSHGKHLLSRLEQKSDIRGVVGAYGTNYSYLASVESTKNGANYKKTKQHYVSIALTQ